MLAFRRPVAPSGALARAVSAPRREASRRIGVTLPRTFPESPRRSRILLMPSARSYLTAMEGDHYNAPPPGRSNADPTVNDAPALSKATLGLTYLVTTPAL